MTYESLKHIANNLARKQFEVLGILLIAGFSKN